MQSWKDKGGAKFGEDISLLTVKLNQSVILEYIDEI